MRTVIISALDELLDDLGGWQSEDVNQYVAALQEASAELSLGIDVEKVLRTHGSTYERERMAKFRFGDYDKGE